MDEKRAKQIEDAAYRAGMERAAEVCEAEERAFRALAEAASRAGNDADLARANVSAFGASACVVKLRALAAAPEDKPAPSESDPIGVAARAYMDALQQTDTGGYECAIAWDERVKKLERAMFALREAEREEVCGDA